MTYIIPILKIRILCQLRLSNRNRIMLFIDGLKYVLEAKNLCSICNKYAEEDLYHFLIECPMYAEIRNFYLKKISYKPKKSNYEKLLKIKNSDLKKINDMYNYIVNSIRIRSFKIN